MKWFETDKRCLFNGEEWNITGVNGSIIFLKSLDGDETLWVTEADISPV